MTRSPEHRTSATADRPTPADRRSPTLASRRPAARAIQLHDAYLVVETPEGMLVIDQHALHERILFEQLRRRVRDGQARTCSGCSSPSRSTCRPSRPAPVLEAEAALAELGLEVEDFGGGTVLLASYPALLGRRAGARSSRASSTTWRRRTGRRRASSCSNDLLATMACHAAVKAGDRLTPEEIAALMQQRHDWPTTRTTARTAGRRRCCSAGRSWTGSSAAFDRRPGVRINTVRPQEPSMRHVLSALVQNQPGVLAHISGMLASRGFNIDSLAVGETEDPDLSRMTFVVHGDDAVLEQVRKQLDKIVTVVKVQDISSEDFVERDLMLIKVERRPDPAAGDRRCSSRCSAAGSWTSTHDTLMIEISGTGGQDRGVHRPDAAVRHPRAGPDRPDRPGPRRADGEGRA